LHLQSFKSLRVKVTGVSKTIGRPGVDFTNNSAPLFLSKQDEKLFWRTTFGQQRTGLAFKGRTDFSSQIQHIDLTNFVKVWGRRLFI
jgi:hypothetical protein